MSRESRDKKPERAEPTGWTSVTPAGDLPACGLSTFKRARYQLVVGRTEAGELFALDNRCPHEGYPLAQGELKGDQLTCCWHNWKFRVGDGCCLLGGEDVRSYPVREQDGEVQVDLTDPDPAKLIPGLRESFSTGLYRGATARALRDGIRLLELGYDPRRLLGDVARQDGLHAEYGSTHVLPLASDCARLLERAPGPEAMYAIAPVVELCAESNARLPEHAPVAARSGATAASFREAVAAEDAERAEALLRSAFEAGLSLGEIASWFYGAVSDHFTDFGHQLIYLVKAEELLPHLERSTAADVLAGLTRSLVYATREDTLPYMKAYRERLDELLPSLPELYRSAREETDYDPAELMEASLDGSSREAMELLAGALRRGVPAPRVARTLVVAAAHRLWRFDERHEADPDVAENWLWATHRFTFAAAVRLATERFRAPDALRFLFQAQAFIHSGWKMDAPPERRLSVEDIGPEAEPSPEGLAAAVERRDPVEALGQLWGLLAKDRSTTTWRAALEDLALAPPLVRPILVAHAIKTVWAALEEYRALEGHVHRELPLFAAVRFLASGAVERRTPAQVRTALRWVIDGVMPRKLTQ